MWVLLGVGSAIITIAGIFLLTKRAGKPKDAAASTATLPVTVKAAEDAARDAPIIAPLSATVAQDMNSGYDMAPLVSAGGQESVLVSTPGVYGDSDAAKSGLLGSSAQHGSGSTHAHGHTHAHGVVSEIKDITSKVTHVIKDSIARVAPGAAHGQAQPLSNSDSDDTPDDGVGRASTTVIDVAPPASDSTQQQHQQQHNAGGGGGASPGGSSSVSSSTFTSTMLDTHAQ